MYSQDNQCAPQIITHRIYNTFRKWFLRRPGPTGHKMCSTGYNPQDIPPSSQKSVEKCRIYPVGDILWSTTEIVLPTGYKMWCTGYHPQDIPPSPQKVGEKYRLYPADISCGQHFISCGQQQKLCCPQDIKCDVQDITHRIYHPLLRNLVRNIGYILWIYPVGNILYPVGNNRNCVAHRI